MQIITTFREMDSSPALQAAAERWGARLEQVCDRIVSCHVSVERPHRHHLHGSPFAIHVVLGVPGAQIAVSHQSSLDPYVALGDAFRTARRRLLEHTDLQRDFTRVPRIGRVVANRA